MRCRVGPVRARACPEGPVRQVNESNHVGGRAPTVAGPGSARAGLVGRGAPDELDGGGPPLGPHRRGQPPLGGAGADGDGQLAHDGVVVVAGEPVQQPGTGSAVVLSTTTAPVLADPGALLAECFGPATLVVEYDDVDDARVIDALRAVGLDGLVDGGIDRELGSAGTGLSAGEAQLLSLARVWMRNPDILVFDEATARIDPHTERQIEAAVARKQARVARRAGKKDETLREDFDLGDSPAPSRNESASPEPQPKKRGRKPIRSAEKRKADDASLEAPVEQPARKRGRGKAAEKLSPEERQSLQQILDNVYESLQDLEEESSDPDVPPRGIIDPFVELPPRNDYPDYYQLIRQPICMKQIETKINKKQYQSLKQFRQDIGLLCANCKQYNEDGSVLYNDANVIEVSLRIILR